MIYYIEKLDEDNNYKIRSEVEERFGSFNTEAYTTGRYVGFISKVDWNDEEIREHLSTMQVGEKYQVIA